MDGIWNRYNLRSTGRIYTFPQIETFELWGYIKNIVYAEKIRNIQQLQERITSAIETITRDTIQKTWQEIEFHLDVSRATNGAHIEMY